MTAEVKKLTPHDLFYKNLKAHPQSEIEGYPPEEIVRICYEVALQCMKEYSQQELSKSEEVKKNYMELIYQVQRKFDGETRHETALKYIKRAEEPSIDTAKAENK